LESDDQEYRRLVRPAVIEINAGQDWPFCKEADALN